MTEIEKCAREHGDLARAYEAIGDAKAATELRRVENLLWALERGEPWRTILPKLGEPTQITTSTRVWWFGCWLQAGHYLFERLGHSVDHERDHPDHPVIAIGRMDGGWAPRMLGDGSITFVNHAVTRSDRDRLEHRSVECPQGQFLVHRVLGGAFTIMSWWDRTQGDTRGGCNSNYIVEGSPTLDDLLTWFPKHFPRQAARLAVNGVELVQVHAS